jgi:hypothetical protein
VVGSFEAAAEAAGAAVGPQETASRAKTVKIENTAKYLERILLLQLDCFFFFLTLTTNFTYAMPWRITSF